MLLQLLYDVKDGLITPATAEARLRAAPFEDIGDALIDHHRAIRQGAPEVIYGAGKTPKQAADIARRLCESGIKNIIVTRCDRAMIDALLQVDPHAQVGEASGLVVLARAAHPNPPPGVILVACAGTSDLPVAEEAVLTAEALGNRVVRITDAGVAGLHRLLAHLPIIQSANVIVAIAGMEGALPSVLGGLTDRPVIAVPTSVGYGASLGGVAALLAMLNSCASGISVVNIDNGFGAGYQAALINRPARIPPEDNA